MTAHERELIRQAIDKLSRDEEEGFDFEGGMRILMKLVGADTSMLDVVFNVKQQSLVSLQRIAARPNAPFKAPRRKKNA